MCTGGKRSICVKCMRTRNFWFLSWCSSSNNNNNNNNNTFMGAVVSIIPNNSKRLRAECFEAYCQCVLLKMQLYPTIYVHCTEVHLSFCTYSHVWEFMRKMYLFEKNYETSSELNGPVPKRKLEVLPPLKGGWGISDVLPLSRISGLSVWSHFSISPILFCSLVLLLFLSYHFLLLAHSPDLFFR